MNNISQVTSYGPALGHKITGGHRETDPSFKDLLGRYINEVNRLQDDADSSIQQLVTGEATDLHQVMVAVEEASLSLELTLEIRNKFMEAYQELMRTQV